MTSNISTHGTSHLRAILSAALESPSGIRIEGLAKGKATHLRASLHALRAEERKKSRKVYPDPSDPNHNRSAYDSLITEILQEEDSSEVTLRISTSSANAANFLVIDEETGKPIDLKEFLE